MQGLTLTATVCCILWLPIVATGQATRDTAAYQRIKMFLDSVQIVDTHDHLRPFGRLLVGPGHAPPDVETERGRGLNLYALWARSYYRSIYKRLTPWKPWQPFAEWWSRAKDDFDDARALSQYRYMVVAFQDLYGIDFDSTTDAAGLVGGGKQTRQARGMVKTSLDAIQRGSLELWLDTRRRPA